MKKGKLSVIVCIFLLLVITAFIYTQAVGTDKEDKNSSTQLSAKEQKEIEDFSESLYQEGGFLNELGEELKKAGYSHGMMGMVYSKDDIRLHIVIPNNEVVTKQTQEEVNKIYDDVISKFSLDPKAFKIKVGHAEN